MTAMAPFGRGGSSNNSLETIKKNTNPTPMRTNY